MKKGNVFIAIGLLLIAAAFLLIGYNLWDNSRAGKAAHVALAQLTPHIGIAPAASHEPESPDDIEYPDYILNPEMEMPVQNIDGQDYVGVLEIPALELELPVISDWSYPQLKIAPCRYQGTPYLDNFVILAHNYVRHFGALRNLSYGDVITFTDMDGNIFNYKVIEIVILQPTATEEMTTGDWDMTLFTCTVSGTTRVTVRCERM